MTQATKQSSPWLDLRSLPEPLIHADFILEPLGEKHAAPDFEALMSCRTRLREELQWRDRPPEDFTLELNRADLRRHDDEFSRGEAFAWTVLSPDRARCLGCVYLERCAEIDGAQLAFWVIDEALDLEKVLITALLDWIHESWSINSILIPLREANTRGIKLARECGLPTLDSQLEGPLAAHRCFISELANPGEEWPPRRDRK